MSNKHEVELSLINLTTHQFLVATESPYSAIKAWKAQIHRDLTVEDHKSLCARIKGIKIQQRKKGDCLFFSLVTVSVLKHERHRCRASYQQAQLRESNSMPLAYVKSIECDRNNKITAYRVSL